MTSLHYFDEYGTDTDRDSSKRSLGGQTETAMDYPQTTQSRNSSLTSTSITQYASAQQQQKDGGSEEYPRWTGRTPAVHKRRQAPEYEVTELIRMDPLHLFFLGFVPPFFGAVGSIVTVRFSISSISVV